VRHAPARIGEVTVNQLMSFGSVQVYTTGRWIGKTLDISETSFECSQLTARSRWTLVPLGSPKLNTS